MYSLRVKRRIALFANSLAGLETAKYLDNEDQIVLLFLANQYPDIDEKIRNSLSSQTNVQVHYGDLRNDLEKFVDIVRNANIEAAITVYWPHLLPMAVINLCGITVNFHPALLPLNKGWHPHVYNILESSPAGVTLHKLSEDVDGGDIWAQKELSVLPWECAGDLYSRLQGEIVDLFKQNWAKIKNAQIIPYAQQDEKGTYNSKARIDTLDKINLDDETSFRRLINLLRARTFGEKGYAYYEIDGVKVSIQIILKKIN
jgi:methionyl-tRNA formyltransferase